MQPAKSLTPKDRTRLAVVADAEKTPEQTRTTLLQIQPISPTELSFIRLREVLMISGMSRTTIYESIKKGAFPSPVKLGGRSSGWVKSEVLQWAQNCIDSSRVK